MLRILHINFEKYIKSIYTGFASLPKHTVTKTKTKTLKYQEDQAKIKLNRHDIFA